MYCSVPAEATQSLYGQFLKGGLLYWLPKTMLWALGPPLPAPKALPESVIMEEESRQRHSLLYPSKSYSAVVDGHSALGLKSKGFC